MKNILFYVIVLSCAVTACNKKSFTCPTYILDTPSEKNAPILGKRVYSGMDYGIATVKQETSAANKQ